MTTPRNFCHDEAARVIGDSAATAASGRPLSVLPRRSQPRGCAVRALAKVAAASAVTTTVWRGVLALRGGRGDAIAFLVAACVSSASDDVRGSESDVDVSQSKMATGGEPVFHDHGGEYAADGLAAERHLSRQDVSCRSDPT